MQNTCNLAPEQAIEARSTTPEAKAQALTQALSNLENLAIGTVATHESYDSLEQGCLSCSGTAPDL